MPYDWAAIGAPTRLSGFGSGSALVANQEDGGYAVASESHVQAFAADGTPLGAGVDFHARFDRPGDVVELIALYDGNYVLTYTPDVHALAYILIDGDDGSIIASRSVSAATSGDAGGDYKLFYPGADALLDGGFVFHYRLVSDDEFYFQDDLWFDVSSAGEPGDLRYRVSGGDSNDVGPPSAHAVPGGYEAEWQFQGTDQSHTVVTPGADGTDLGDITDVAQLTDGRYVVVYDGHARIYTSGWNASGGEIDVDAPAGSVLEVEALGDGGFEVSWKADESFVQDFDSSGASEGPPTAIEDADTRASAFTGAAGTWVQHEYWVPVIEGDEHDNGIGGTTHRDLIRGLDGNDQITGGLEGDRLEGGAGDDRLNGDEGDDSVIGGIGADQLTGAIGNDLLDGGDGDDRLEGGLGSDVLLGGGGNDLLIVDAIPVLADGGAGEDIARIRANMVVPTGVFFVESFQVSSGRTVNFSLLGSGVTATVLDGAGGSIIGTAFTDRLGGGVGNDVLDGGAGADILTGGLGNDSYYVDVAQDIVVELAGQGRDKVYSLIGLQLGANVDDLVLLAAAGAANGSGNGIANALTGNNFANILNGFEDSDTLTGNGGNDALIGGTGADLMSGGLGDDMYFVDDAGDRAVESVGQGRDKVYADIAFTLGDNVEDLTLQAAAGAAAGAGNDLANVLTGNASANGLSGREGADVLIGNGGNDAMDGGLGSDQMFGGAGDDLYFVDAGGDRVTEAAGEGRDKIYAAISLTLGANVEDLTLLDGAVDGTGNALNNVLTGNAAANRLSGNDGADALIGNGGNDVLLGGAGADILSGGEGNDALDGGSGADAMSGGLGDDLYLVDNAGDTIGELAGQGRDKVLANLSHTLGANVEDLALQAAAGAASGTGNALANVIGGNASANELLGLGGADTLIGNGGNDLLDGGAGNDVLSGGVGNDSFQFTAPLGAGNIDRILDFSVLDDGILIDNAVFIGLAAGPLPAGAFAIGTAAADAEDRIIYDSATGALYFDSDGTGAAAQVQFATVQAGLAMTAADFTVI